MSLRSHSSDLFPSFTSVHVLRNNDTQKTGELLSQCQLKTKDSKHSEVDEGHH